MTINGWIQIALYCVIIIALTQAVRRLHDARLRRRAHLSAARSCARSSARIYWRLRRRREGGAALADLCRRHAVLQRRGLRHALRAAAPAGRAAVQSAGPDARSSRASPSTRRSASSPTPTGSPTCGETTMSYLVQMAGLTVHNFVSAATGIALAIALVRGFARRSAQDDRQFLGRSDPLHALHPAADLDRRRPVLRLAGHAAESRRLCRGDDARRRQADDRAGPGRLAGSRSRCSAPTAAASSTPTPPIRSRTRTRSPTSSQMWSDLRDRRRRSPTCFGRMVGDQRQGWALFAAMGVLFLAGVDDRLLGRGARQSGLRRARRRSARRARCRPAATWKARRSASASPIRRCSPPSTTDASCGAVNSMHDSFMPLGGMVPMVNISSASHLRRRRLGPLRHAALRHRRGVHRRADGRAHAGISRQEDRGEGGQDGDARASSILPLVDPRLHRARDGAARRARRHRQRRAARLQRDPLRLHLGHRQQRQRLRRAHRQHALL